MIGALGVPSWRFSNCSFMDACLRRSGRCNLSCLLPLEGPGEVGQPIQGLQTLSQAQRMPASQLLAAAAFKGGLGPIYGFIRIHSFFALVFEYPAQMLDVVQITGPPSRLLHADQRRDRDKALVVIPLAYAGSKFKVQRRTVIPTQLELDGDV